MSSIPTVNRQSKSSTGKSKELDELKRDVMYLKESIQVAFNKVQYDRTLTDAQRSFQEKKMEQMERDVENLNQLIIDRMGVV